VRRLVISDLHFGGSGALATYASILERLETELAWAEEVIICGDLFTLLHVDWRTAATQARPFLDMLRRHVPSLAFIPGNHDHHLVMWDQDLRRRDAVFSLGEQAEPQRLGHTEAFLRSLLPGVEVRAHYPFVTLDGVSYIHGHQVTALVREVGIEALDNLLIRWQANHPRHLEPEEYEALIAPSLEMTYLTRRLEAGPHSERQMEALFRWSRASLAASSSLRATNINLAGRALSLLLHLRPRLRPARSRLKLMAHVCQDLGVPAGPVIYAHTHMPHDARQAPGYPEHTFHNSGSWHYDEGLWRRGLKISPPGTVLRVEGGRIDRHELLGDLDDAALQRLLRQQNDAV